MGLFRKRWLLRVEEAVAATKGKLREATGADIQLQVDEASFPDSEEVLNDFFVHEIYGLAGVAKALELVARDALGKEAMQEQVKTVLLRNTAERFDDAGSKSVSLNDGVLTISCAFNQSSDNLYRPDELAKVLEKLL